MWKRSTALAFTLPFFATAQIHTTLEPGTIEAFDSYLKVNEPKMTTSARFAQLNPDEIRVEAANDKGTIDVHKGVVHDWVGATFVPGAKVEQALAVLQNYPEYKNIYKPEIIDSKLLSHTGNQWKPYLKIVKTKVLTAVLNTEYNVEYRDLGSGRWTVTSRSTKVAEVENEKELPEGTGFGFLWRLNAYWILEQRSDGLYMECRSISLSRDIPFGLGAVVGGFVNSLPTESLHATLGSTAKALGRPAAR